jgi:zinc protease
MVNSLFETKEVESERTVIISERQGHENEPTFRLAEEVQAAAFRVNGYHHRVIGDLTDLHTMTRDDLYGHYRANYVPSNAVLSVVGDFKTGTMLDKIRAAFGNLPTDKVEAFDARPEPPQLGEKVVHVEGPGETPFIKVAYHAPPASADDFIPMAVLSSVLAGASSFNFFSGGISNKTSRLYRALVDGEVAASIQGGLAATIDPYLYTIHITIRPDKDPEEALAILDKEMDQIAAHPIEERELEKAIKQAKALFAYSSESITNQGFWLGFTEMFDGYEWLETYLERISEVTPESAWDCARRYLARSNRIVGMYHPTEKVDHA